MNATNRDFSQLNDKQGKNNSLFNLPGDNKTVYFLVFRKETSPWLINVS